VPRAAAQEFELPMNFARNVGQGTQ
jgi:hypothetical protein